MKQPCILIVDDEEMIRQIVMRAIPENSQTFEAPDGVAALEIIKNHPEIDLVITDIKMPKMDGLELSRNITKLDSYLPIIVVSAFDDRDNILEALRIGVYDFIPKPFEFEFARNRILRALEKRELYQSENKLIHLLQETLGIKHDNEFRKLSYMDRLDYINELTTVLTIKFERTGK